MREMRLHAAVSFRVDQTVRGLRMRVNLARRGPRGLRPDEGWLQS